MLNDILQMLEMHPIERLKWCVCREFGVLPGSEATLQLTDYDYVCCGANLLLDKRIREEKRIAETVRDVNPQFDLVRFAELRKGNLI